MSANKEREAALCDAAYVAGAQAGFDAAASGDPEALNKLITSRAGYLAVLKATRATIPSTSTDGVQAADPQWLADQVKNGIADFISDHWPDRRHGLGDIVANIQRIEVNATRIILLAGAAASPKEHP